MSDNYDVLKKEIVINAPVEKVYSALITPEQLTQWFPNIVTIEPKIGGKVSFRFLKESTQEDKDHEIVGEIVTFIPNKELSYTGILQQSLNIIKILLLRGSLSN